MLLSPPPFCACNWALWRRLKFVFLLFDKRVFIVRLLSLRVFFVLLDFSICIFASIGCEMKVRVRVLT